jgi:nucleoside-diphosphate-sugar epimerase
MVKRILITGSTGFVGRQILKALLASDLDITVVVRPSNQTEGVSTETPVRRIVTQDMFKETEDWWARQCEGIDTVIHAAWYTEPGKYQNSSLNIDCLNGSLALAKGVISAGISRFVGVGTCFEYDLTLGVLSTVTPLKPSTPYAATKAALYLALSRLLPLESIEFAWCRLFYLYGEREDSRRLAPYIHRQLSEGKEALLTAGTQIRDYLNVAIAGDLIAKAALGNQLGALNICSGIPQSVREFAENIASEYGRSDLLTFGARENNPTDPPCVVGIPSRLN